MGHHYNRLARISGLGIGFYYTFAVFMVWLNCLVFGSDKDALVFFDALTVGPDYAIVSVGLELSVSADLYSCTQANAANLSKIEAVN